jgi:hypothetical protein
MGNGSREMSTDNETTQIGASKAPNQCRLIRVNEED